MRARDAFADADNVFNTLPRRPLSTVPAPEATLQMNAKSAWVTNGILEVVERFASNRVLNCLAKSFEICSARWTTSGDTPARLATCVPKDDSAAPLVSLYVKTSW